MSFNKTIKDIERVTVKLRYGYYLGEGMIWKTGKPDIYKDSYILVDNEGKKYYLQVARNSSMASEMCLSDKNIIYTISARIIKPNKGEYLYLYNPRLLKAEAICN